MTDYSVWVLEYGYVDRFPASNLFAAQPNAGYRRMPYCFALVRSAQRCILVDTGFADEATYDRLTAKYGRTQWAPPTEVLRRAGVHPNEVDTVLLTHNHFDHAGCAAAFRNAHLYIQRRELTEYSAALALPRRFEFLTRSCEPTLPGLFEERARAGLATLADGELEVAPGVLLRPAFGTHTAGSQVVSVTDIQNGPWFLAGDNVYAYENLDGLGGDGILAPIAMTTGSAADWLRFADGLLSAAGGDTRRIIPFHEGRLWERSRRGSSPTACILPRSPLPPATTAWSRTTNTTGAAMSLTQRQQQIKDEFIKVRGTWSDAWEDILRLDEEFLASYLKFSAVPWRKNHLDDKVKEFIYLAVDANATHLYLPGIRQHIAAALRLGATPQEIMEVLELSATLGIHAMNIGVPILVEVLEEKGLRTGPAPLTEYQEQLKAEFTVTRGYWHSFWDEMLELDPELFAAYTEFSSYPWHHGTLAPKIKEFIYIAFDTAATHLYVKGLKLHIENALGYGATPQEILEVMEIASVLGIHAVTTAAPILAELVRDTQPAGDEA